jgi:hypothetical protein
MKRTLKSVVLLALLLCATIFQTANAQVVEINESNFPDANFRSYLETTFGTENSDGTYYIKDAQNGVSTINCSGKGIVSLQGIEKFINLRILNCSNNAITGTLDLTSNTAITNINCSHNKISTLVADKAVQYLNCSSNSLASIDVTQLGSMIKMNCDSNSLTSLDLTGTNSLQHLYCNYNNLAALDISKTNPNIDELYCSNNPSLANLNLGEANLNQLKTMNCSHCNLSSIDMSNLVALLNFNCSNNKLKSLDLSTCPNIDSLDYTNNNLNSIDYSKQDHLKSVVQIPNGRSITIKKLVEKDANGNLNPVLDKNGKQIYYVDYKDLNTLIGDGFDSTRVVPKSWKNAYVDNNFANKFGQVLIITGEPFEYDYYTHCTRGEGANISTITINHYYLNWDASTVVTAVENISANNNFTVKGAQNSIAISADKQQRVAVYDLTGRLVANQVVNAGETVINDVPAGFYIVNGTKIVVK